jgi:N-acetylneuraminate synthase
MAKVEIIAEVATNHGGDLGLAWRFIRECAKAGVDTVKFQMTRWHHLRMDDAQSKWFWQAQLPDRELRTLSAMCADSGVGFLLTAYHADDVAFVREVSPRIKVGSGEAGEVSVAKAIKAAGFAEVLVSYGIGGPRMLLYGAPTQRLACVSRYPAPPGIAYAALTDHRYAFDGWSDHAIGLSECQAAIVAGARIVEVHVQLPGQARPARPFEKTMDELRQLREFANEDPKRFLGRWQRG